MAHTGTPRDALTGFAVDLGGTKIAAARIVAGRIVARRQVPTDADARPDQHVAAMAEVLQALGHDRGAPLGVAVTGRLDRFGLWHAINTGTLTGVGGVALCRIIDKAIGPAACINDAAAATLAEARFGAGRGAAHFAYLTVSTGVGGGLVLNHRLVQSGSGLAGHVGFATSPLAPDTCGSGRHGTVESVAGGRAIAAAAMASGREGDARAVIEAAQGGAAWAEAIVQRSARAIAILLADLVATLGLDRVAIGGSIGLSPGYIDRVVCALASEPPLFHVPVTPAAFGTDAPLIGALAAQHEPHDP
jgi:predicted NBD/HSP70 family sugar kinase